MEETIARRVGACAATVRVPGGLASVSWAFSGGALTYNLSVPFLYTAELRLPGAVEGVKSGSWLQADLGAALIQVQGATEGVVRGAAGELVLALSGGNHSVTVPYK